MTEPTIQQLLPDNASSADTNGPQSNASATVSYPGVNNYSHVLSGVAWSYSGSGTLAGGNLQVLDGATVVFQIDVTTLGPGFVPFLPEKQGTPGNSLSIILAAG